MAGLPLNLPYSQQSTKWKSQLDPVVSNALLQGQLLPGIPLGDGTTVINHGLGRKLVGWFIVGVDGPATIYDKQASNQTPQLTLVLASNAAVTCNLWVF
jgi:hypothetical protein